MRNIAYRKQLIHDIQHVADEISTARSDRDLVVGVIAPGPPGIGKTQATLSLLADQGRGRFVGQSHEQARERRNEATKLLRDTGRTHLLVRHIQGLGRRCLYLTEDKWAEKAWSFGTVACDQCPTKKQCPGIQQHWQHTDIHVGVSPMEHWSKPGLLAIDELPDPVSTRTFTSTELTRIGSVVLHPALMAWRAMFATLWTKLVRDLEEIAAAHPDPKVWGSTVYLGNAFPPGSDARRDLDALCDYFHNFPVPPPPADEVRRGTIRPEHWIANDLEFLVKTIRWESDCVPMEVRLELGQVYAACLRVYGDSKGNYLDFSVELRNRWTPPSEAHIILDSTAPMSREVYSRLYKNFSMIEAFRTVPLPSEQEGLELVTYPTLAFARSRSLNNANYMLRPGTAARIRALREIIYKVRQVRKSRFDKVRVGIIDHKAVLAAMGYDFHNNAVLSGPLVARQSVAPDLLLDETLAELEGIAELVVGYHGGVVGSNLFKDVRLLAVLGDPTGHIGMLAEEARTMDMSAAGYIRWRVSMNAVQEVFRGRLLDADDANKKTVLYFGRYAPDLTSMGRTWRMLPWPEGGRLLSRPAHAFTAAIWEMIGHSSTIVGTLMPEFAGMHATPIGSLLYALRASEESWDSSSPRTRELYRRTARAVADQQGLRTFDIPHPLGGRKPVPVHAASLEDALKAMAEVEDQLSSMPSWRMKDVAQLAEAAEVQRDADATLSAKVETIRDEVTRLKQEWRQQHEQLQTHNWLRLSSTDLNTTEGRLFADAQDAALATALADLRTCYRQQIADTLAQWRALKGKYKNREPLVTSRAEVLRFAYRGIAF